MSYKIIPPNHPVEVGVSLEEGLLLCANPLCKFIIESAMARAQFLHPATICHYLVHSTHIHFMMLVHDPADITGFIERFKTESAHYINAMLGRKKRTVWCEGFFCAPILTLSSAMKKIRYIYTNPAKDGMVASIEDFPGLSSWSAFRTGRHSKICKRLHRPMIPYLPEKFYPQNTYKRLMRDLKSRTVTSHTLTVEPDAWMRCFDVTDDAERRDINEQVFEMIQEEEARRAALRKEKGSSVVGREALAAAHLDLDYVPRRSGRKMWCICDNKELRIRYIRWAKDLKQQAREVYERWKLGDFSLSFPPGVFPPARPRLANMTPLAVCY